MRFNGVWGGVRAKVATIFVYLDLGESTSVTTLVYARIILPCDTQTPTAVITITNPVAAAATRTSLPAMDTDLFVVYHARTAYVFRVIECALVRW